MDNALAKKILTDFSNEANRVHSYGYATGYYESVLTELLAEVKPDRCMAILNQVVNATKKLAEEKSK
jgi:hypothetical protein